MLDGDTVVQDTFDPFNPVPEPEQDKEALIRSLELAQKWTLLFVVCNSPDERNRLMDEVTERLPGKNVQRLPVAQEVGSLSDVMRQQITAPPPDVLFVYGIERWLSGAVNPRSVPFLLNLNAARDVFPEIMQGPMVVWLPQFALEAIANAAPDFFSVRSGVYTFPLVANQRSHLLQMAKRTGQVDIIGLSTPDREEQVLNMESLLSELSSLPNRDLLEEARIQNQLGIALLTIGNNHEAEAKLKIAVKTRQDILGKHHEDSLTSLINLSNVYSAQKRYTEAEAICEDVLKNPVNKNSDVLALISVANIHTDKEDFEKAKVCLEDALDKIKKSKSQSYEPLSTVLLNLSVAYNKLGMHAIAKEYSLKSLKISEKVLGVDHSHIIPNIIEVAKSYVYMSMYIEAESFFIRALTICKVRLSVEDATRVSVEKDFYSFLRMKHRAGKASTVISIEQKSHQGAVQIKRQLQQTPKKKSQIVF